MLPNCLFDKIGSDDDDDPTPLNKKIKTESLDYQELSAYKIPGTTIDILLILLQQQEVIETKMNNKRTKTNSTNYLYFIVILLRIVIKLLEISLTRVYGKTVKLVSRLLKMCIVGVSIFLKMFVYYQV